MRWGNTSGIQGPVYLFDVDEREWGEAIEFPFHYDLSKHFGENLLTEDLFYPIVREGWSFIEPWGIWTDGGKSSLVFPPIPRTKTACRLEMDCNAFLIEKVPQQPYTIFLNDEPVDSGMIQAQ